MVVVAGCVVSVLVSTEPVSDEVVVVGCVVTVFTCPEPVSVACPELVSAVSVVVAEVAEVVEATVCVLIGYVAVTVVDSRGVNGVEVVSVLACPELVSVVSGVVAEVVVDADVAEAGLYPVAVVISS